MIARIKRYWKTPFDMLDIAIIVALLVLLMAIGNAYTNNAINQCTKSHSQAYCERGLN